ncbi:MAG TPA: hypothetical protein VFP65_10625 [Anaeromyxobacteraceae bacterium]|nr:hypothetical protein [Anaeromyxobacteraceae bacterium]
MRSPGRRAAAAIAGSALLLAALGAASPASARAPFLADDAEPIAPEAWEVIFASRSSFDPDGFVGTAPEVEVNWGFAPGLQLHALAPLTVAAHAGDRRVGPGDLTVGAKARLADKTYGDVRGQIALFPKLSFPSGTPGLGQGRAVFFLPVWAETSYGPWAAYGGGGIRTATAAFPSGSFFFGWVLQRRLGRGLVGAEIVYEAAAQRERPPRSGGSLGGGVDVSARHHLLASFGFGTAPRDLRAYLGWLVAWGGAVAGE